MAGDDQLQLLGQSLEEEQHRDEGHAPVSEWIPSFRRSTIAAFLLSTALIAVAVVKSGGGMTEITKNGYPSKLFLNHVGSNVNSGTQAQSINTDGGNVNTIGSQTNNNEQNYGTVNNGDSTNIKNHDGMVGVGVKQIKPCEGSGNDGSGAGAVGVVCCMSPNGQKQGCDHASSGSGSSGGGSGSGGGLEGFLKSKHLSSMVEPLSKLGVKHKSDMKYLDKKKIQELHPTFIQKQKLEEIVDQQK